MATQSVNIEMEIDRPGDAPIRVRLAVSRVPCTGEGVALPDIEALGPGPLEGFLFQVTHVWHTPERMPEVAAVLFGEVRP